MSTIIFTVLLLVVHTAGESVSESGCEATTCCRLMTRMTTLLEAMNFKLGDQWIQLEDLKMQLYKTRTSVLDQLDKQSKDIHSLNASFLSPQDPKSPLESILGTKIEPRDCNDLRDQGASKSGIYEIKGRINAKVFCDMSSPNDTWLVFQRRSNGNLDFDKTWVEYQNGFGDLNDEFWLGNDILSQLTMNRKYKLRIELEDFEGEKRYAEYSTFSVGPATEQYKLTVSGYSGTAGDSFTVQNGMKFSTKDVDNDIWENNCAQTFRGAWWYSICLESNLNGLYLEGPHTSYADGIDWVSWHGHYYSLKTTEMKISAVA